MNEKSTYEELDRACTDWRVENGKLRQRLEAFEKLAEELLIESDWDGNELHATPSYLIQRLRTLTAK